jgi:hypothetical protein
MKRRPGRRAATRPAHVIPCRSVPFLGLIAAGTPRSCLLEDVIP